MLISARESSRILAGTGISRQQSRRALLAGLAGRAVHTGGALLYDDDKVRELGGWRAVDHDELLAACPGGVFVVRLAPGAELDVTWPWSQRVDLVRDQPHLGLSAWLQVAAYLSVHGRLACVVTVCGYPVLLADLVSFRTKPGERIDLGLEPPGAWSTLLQGHRLLTSPGPPWLVLGAQPYLGRAVRSRESGLAANAGRADTWSRWA